MEQYNNDKSEIREPNYATIWYTSNGFSINNYS